MLLEVSVISPEEVLFEGRAKSIIVPGEEGVFEVLPFHKRILSRLLSGVIFVDDKNFPVNRGIIKADQGKVTIIVE